MFRIFWFESEGCFILWGRSGLSTWEETGDPESKDLVYCIVWSPVLWAMRVRGVNLTFLRG